MIFFQQKKLRSIENENILNISAIVQNFFYRVLRILNGLLGAMLQNFLCRNRWDHRVLGMYHVKSLLRFFEEPTLDQFAVLPISDVFGSNSFISNLLSTVNCIENTKIKKKEANREPFLYLMHLYIQICTIRKKYTLGRQSQFFLCKFVRVQTHLGRVQTHLQCKLIQSANSFRVQTHLVLRHKSFCTFQLLGLYGIIVLQF